MSTPAKMASGDTIKPPPMRALPDRSDRALGARCVGSLCVLREVHPPPPEVQKEEEVVRVLDAETSDNEKVTVSIRRSGALVIQTFQECGRGARLVWRRTGTARFPAVDIKEWASALCHSLGLHPTPAMRRTRKGKDT